MKENQNIDELLNGFIDGELTQRERVEVQRLTSNDAQVARRLYELQQCKVLVGSLPSAEAPPEIIEGVKSSLERRTLLGEQAKHFEERRGARHLLARKVLAAAAMVGLLAALAAVIYTIVAPERGPDQRLVAAGGPRPPLKQVSTPGRTGGVAVERIVAATGLPEGGMSARLELRTVDFAAVDAFINRAIVDNGLSQEVAAPAGPKISAYAFSCSRRALRLLLADLAKVWARFDSPTLYVDTEQFGQQVVVEAVGPEQIVEIADQNSYKSCIKAARDFAALNRIAARLPAQEVLAAVEDNGGELIPIPKPLLTSGRATAKKSAQPQDEEQVHLAIVVIGGE
jgi:hypothetical protein